MFSDTELDDAVASAIRWPRDAKRGWVWGWADPAANLSSLWAMTMAAYGAMKVPEAPAAWRGVLVV